MEFKIEHYNLADIFQRCQQKLAQQQENKEKINIQLGTINEIWTQFYKWTKAQLDLERTLSIPNFGNIAHKRGDSVYDKEKIIQIYMSENFIAQHNLKYRGDFDSSNYPPVKINYSTIQKLVPELNKNQIKMVLDTIFSEVTQLLSQTSANVQVDLGQLGKMSVFEKTFSFEPVLISKKNQGLSNKSTVRNLLNQRRNLGLSSSVANLKDPFNQFSNNNSGILNNESGLNLEQNMQNSSQNEKVYQQQQQLPALSQTQQYSQRDNNNNQKFISHQYSQSTKNMNQQNNQINLFGGSNYNQQSQPSFKMRPKIHHSYNPSFPNFSQSDKNISSPTRRFKIENVKIDPELLAAGTDPLSKNQDFSKLANKAANLINANFQKPAYSAIRFPPILDKFSRTLAAPLAAQKHNLSVSNRIANNYSAYAKKLYFDRESKGIKILKLFETAVAFTANNELLRIPATLEEELDYVVKKVKNKDLEIKMEAKKTCYKRYKGYIENEISVDFIAPMNHQWITEILEVIPHQLQYVDGPTMTNMIDKMLNEINRDYYESVKKSILDYVLKDEDERKRIGIMSTFDEVVDYGERAYRGVEADDEWKEHVEMARNEISQNLVLCSSATLEIMELWKKYEKMYFLVLPSKKDQIMTINNFLEIQDKNIKEVKNHLISEWHKDIIEIFKEELTQMNQNKKMAVLFFESNATLMSNQIRQLVTESLHLYKDFFQRFKKETLFTPEEIIKRDENAQNSQEDAFLQVTLIPDESNMQHIIFKNDLSVIKQKLLGIIDFIVEMSRNFPRAENHIARSEKTALWDIPADDETYVSVRGEIEGILDRNLENIGKVLQIYEKFVFLLSERQRVQDWVENGSHSREEYNRELKKYQDLYVQVNKEIPFYVRMNMIVIDGTDIKKQFLRICTEIEQSLQTQIHVYIMKRSTDILNDINKRLDSLKEKASNTDILVDLQDKKEDLKAKQHKRIKEEFSDLMKWLDLLLKTDFALEEKNLKEVFETSKAVHSIMDQVDREENRIESEKEVLEQNLRKRKEDFTISIEEINKAINMISEQYATEYETESAVEKMKEYREEINMYMEQMQEINKQERQLDWQETEFQTLSQAHNNLIPFEKLWFLVKEKMEKLQNWQKQKTIFELDPDSMEKELKEMEKTVKQLITQNFKGPNFERPMKLANDVASELRNFKQNIKLARVFSQQGLKERHWQEIFELTNIRISPSDTTIKWTLNKLQAQDFHQNLEQLQKLEMISESAQKEFSIEKVLEKMKEDWLPLSVELKEWKNTGSYILAGATVDEVQTILDDQIVKTMTMKGSPYAKVFEERILEWEDFLNYTQNLIDMWIKVQAVWVYLEPVMTAPDIKMKLKKEGDEFEKVDKTWRNEVIGKVVKEKRILEFTKDRKMLMDLKVANERLEQVQKGLNYYLEEKRSVFPRFYFLGNDELLEILSETKEPSRVQPHLKKCFEGINRLEFKGNQIIEGMYSSEKEYVHFIDSIDTSKAFGNVDQWLVWVEEQMIASIKSAHERGFQQFPNMKRNDFIKNRCGMAVLSVNMIYWTFNVEQAMNSEGLTGVQKYHQSLKQQLEDVVHLVRSPISPLDRCTVEALIVLDVHNRDVVHSLVDDKITSVLEFGWTSQMRYYWQDENVIVKIINAVLEYNYEYLGNSSRLVITPLTDRCYRTLCGAVHLNYGGAPEGPAGTGKTETVKDLAKALARQCVVFNCSDGLDYKAMGKFFKGLAQSGAWSCFDEFNRIDLEVLSVVASQIQTITEARKLSRNEFEFEGSLIKLKKTANTFITMNPGYAGRSELPDNLKALFRSVAMMVPDYAMISEIVLYSFGFTDGKNLARKIVTTYKLCSEQLSSQPHYDYGMRAVKSVLTAAGNLKRKYPEEDESVLMLRGINDVNLAKFLNFDLPLFKGITSDLFPGISLPEIDYKDMYVCIDETLKEKNLQNIDYLQNKIIQLYEMILVRHGLMVVGLPFSGKSTILHVLAGALTKLKEKGQMNENATQIITLNPKSISMQLLYGFSDEISHEWTDGVLAKKFKQFAKDESDDRKWLIFDGPIDAVWIENMNTVLDDNKKLCLNSGEIVAMNKAMNMIFEPMDLEAASPATVSRCGMIYMEPTGMGWKPIYQSWKNNGIPSYYKSEDIDEIDLMFSWMVDPILYYIRHKGHEVSPTQDQNLIFTCLKILKKMLTLFEDEQIYNKLEIGPRQEIIHSMFIFSLVWSLGGSLTEKEARRKFDIYVKRVAALEIELELPEEIKPKKISKGIPDRGMVYDYSFQLNENKSGGEWILWTDLISANEREMINRSKKPQELIIPTVDTVRYKYLLATNINLENPTLFCGPTGTGKSVYIKDYIYSLPRNEYKVVEIGFSAQTTSGQVQEIFDISCDKRRKGVYGPKQGNMIVFIDDLNMPQKEKWGAQPPIELIRQIFDQGGYYDNKEKEKPFKQLENLIFCAAMGPPGGGRSFITPRILRHFNLVSLNMFDDESLTLIFSTILKNYLNNNGFNQEVVKQENKIIQSTIKVYRFAMEELRPTPAKSHYLFNLRDFSKVILGMCMADKEKVDTPEIFTRLWVHESQRVFSDRLISVEDRMKMLEFLRETVRRTIGHNFETVFEHLIKEGNKELKTLDEIRGLMFSDILTPAGVPKRPYEEIRDQQALQRACEEALENYNMMGDKPMDLVMFQFAIEHLLIIARILKSPGGNALLVGVGGSGRQSLTRLAASMSDIVTIQIEISKMYGKNEWQEDLKKVLKSAGGKNQPTVFLFTDSQIKMESFVEDINNLLNTCEVPNLFPPDEKQEVLEMIRPIARQEGKATEGTPEQLYTFFVDKCKQNLHVVLAFSPIGEGFRTRVRMFPSLVNCCTIDWFFEWPQDALVSVAEKFMDKIEMEQDIKASCTKLVQTFHENTIEWADKFYSHLNRKYYVTPTSYLEMIITFQNLLDEKRKFVKDQIFKYENGYNQIIKTEAKVGDMQIKLEELVPKIKVSAEEAAKKEVVVTEKKQAADIIAEGIAKEEATIQIDVDKATEIENQVNSELEKAMPALRQAEQALLKINKQATDFIKNLPNPPAPIRATMKAICLIMYPNPGSEFKEKNKDTLKLELNWWKVSQKILGDIELVNKMKDFKKEEMTEQLVSNLGKYLDDPANKENLDEVKVQNASSEVYSMLLWAKAMRSFYYVNKEVLPKKVALEEAQTKVRGLRAQLAVKQADLKKATDEVKALNDDLQRTIQNKNKLEKDYQDNSVQLERAKQLIESLGGEKGRWQELAEQLKFDYVNLTGDVLVSSGLIAYLGAFTPSYRNDITNAWVQLTKEYKIPGSEKFSLKQVLGDPVKIRSWNIDGLPSDNFSVENGIIIFKSRRWPLCIDPQGQANKWIKKMETPRKLDVIKLTDNDYIRKLENAIFFGKPVLLENVLEEVDASLTPILLKQTFVKGTTTYIKLGENALEYNADFRFYMTSKLRNPHYLPELSTKVAIINFMITYEGLNDQLLGILVKEEKPELEIEKERLIVEGAENKAALADIENKILQVLSGDKDILTDESAINILKDSKSTSNMINEKQVIAEKTEVEIDEARQKYQPVSQQASSLFFTISELNNLDPMYQYSLAYFIDLFATGIKLSEKSADFNKRLNILKNYFVFSLYQNICRSLFEKDKLVFSMLLTCRLMQFRQQLDASHWRFLITGGTGIVDNPPEKPKNQNWISTKMWLEIVKLSKIIEFDEPENEFYKNFYDSQNIEEFKKIYDANEAHTIPLPSKLKEKYTGFKYLMILRTLRPDKMEPAIRNFVTEKMGKKFIEPPSFDLAEIYRDSSPITPLIFVLSPGSDPFASLTAYAKKQGKDAQVKKISLGQGQGPIAEQTILAGKEAGDWVVLQNCHLATSWMTTLEKLCEEISPDPSKTHPEFRLWLTSYPSPNFPTSVLQAGIKMTNEPPKGLKSNLLGSYYTDPIKEEEFFEGCAQPQIFKKLLYGLTFFHAVIQERRNYGPLGWNISYEFNESDLRICVQQLKMFLDEFSGEDVPFEALKYLTAECNYGGRVTDDKDRRLIVTLLNDYYCQSTISGENYSFASDPSYQPLSFDSHSDFIQGIKDQIKDVTPPDVFGFHQNADITKNLKETSQLMNSLLECSQVGGGSGNSNQESALDEICRKIYEEFPQPFNIEEVQKKYPVIYEESMNTVLIQEVTRFNNLIKVIRNSLYSIRQAIAGLQVMSPQQEVASRQIFDGKIPDLWLQSSYPSLKPLAGYVDNLVERIGFLQKWIDEGMPNVYWLSGFYFTQSFLTGVLQNFARKYTIPIDLIEFQYQILDSEPSEAAEDGAYINGLFLEGAKFDYNQMQLAESDPKILFVEAPAIKLVPMKTEELQQELQLTSYYKCPVYKTSARRGVLSTTGHSTNFVMWIRLPSEQKESHWIKRGVALLTQLDD